MKKRYRDICRVAIAFKKGAGRTGMKGGVAL
jgi:hypothetical protein